MLNDCDIANKLYNVRISGAWPTHVNEQGGRPHSRLKEESIADGSDSHLAVPDGSSAVVFLPSNPLLESWEI